MVKTLTLGLTEALKLTLERISPLPSETVDVMEAVDRLAAEDFPAKVHSPSVDTSLKDGYAVRSADVASATRECPIRLRLAGAAAAGGREDLQVSPGTAVRILSGAKIPRDADAVVSEEFSTPAGTDVLLHIFSEPGRNILPKGSDVTPGRIVARRGRRLTPGMAGLLAAAGYSRISVIRKPRIAIVATGDEVVAPGQPLPEGKLYASNMVTLGAWCLRYGMSTRLAVAGDDPEEIFEKLKSLSGETDAMLTSGGAWTGDRDLVAQILDRLGWTRVFHRIRIGPGKAVGFGLLGEKPVFILPGGPPSNLIGFLQIAFPGLMALSGDSRAGLPTAPLRVASDLRGPHEDWTQFIFGGIEKGPDLNLFHPLKNTSRLGSMAEAQAIVAIPEGQTLIPTGSVVSAQMLE